MVVFININNCVVSEVFEEFIEKYEDVISYCVVLVLLNLYKVNMVKLKK